MGLLADERKSGTIELLVTKPVSDWQIVAGQIPRSFFADLHHPGAHSSLLYLGCRHRQDRPRGSLDGLYRPVVYERLLYQHWNVRQQYYREPDRGIPGFAVHRDIFSAGIRNTLQHIPGLFGALMNYLSIATHFESMARE